jgi:hypothetical protein
MRDPECGFPNPETRMQNTGFRIPNTESLACIPYLALLSASSFRISMTMPLSARRWTAAEVRDLIDEERAWPRYELIDDELLDAGAASLPPDCGGRTVLVANRLRSRRGLGPCHGVAVGHPARTRDDYVA